MFLQLCSNLADVEHGVHTDTSEEVSAFLEGVEFGEIPE